MLGYKWPPRASPHSLTASPSIPLPSERRKVSQHPFRRSFAVVARHCVSPEPDGEHDTAVPCGCPIPLSDHTTVLPIPTALTRVFSPSVSCTESPPGARRRRPCPRRPAHPPPTNHAAPRPTTPPKDQPDLPPPIPTVAAVHRPLSVSNFTRHRRQPHGGAAHTFLHHCLKLSRRITDQRPLLLPVLFKNLRIG